MLPIWPFTARRRAKLRRLGLPAEHRAIIDRNVPLARALNADDRRAFEGHVAVFLDQKNIEAAAGLELTDEIRVTIAAQACLLLQGREPQRTGYYPGVRTIIVYPRSYVARSTQRGPGGVVTETPSARQGEAWHGPGSGVDGTVILSWCDVQRGAIDPHDGRNVALHEFAHALDAEATGMDGAPRFDDRSRYGPWAKVLSDEFTKLRRAARAGMPTLIDTYGAQNPAEFFAVATEAYFERPDDLRRLHPDLFEQLRGYYGWTPEPSSTAPNAATSEDRA